ncbi:MAG: restriction endonuclease subunit S, partial [Helicobacter sp.]|nr:restriction endonuclease subunit S [Helicobacter sp.]
MSKIQIVWFRDLKTWSAALQNMSILKSHFPLISLREVLKDLTKDRIFTIDDKEFYKEPTISSKSNEISIRKAGIGSEFKVKKRVRILPHDLVIARMHTQNGLYAFANEEFAATQTFIPFEILEEKINKNYLFIVLKQTLARLVKFDSVNRETYKTDEILDLQIPLPPLEIQQEIVHKIQNIKDKIKALQEEEKRLKEEIEAYIY